jgi:hypothetical protein
VLKVYTVALGEAEKIDREQRDGGARGQAQAVLDALVKGALFGREQLHGQNCLGQVVVEADVTPFFFFLSFF